MTAVYDYLFSKEQNVRYAHYLGAVLAVVGAFVYFVYSGNAAAIDQKADQLSQLQQREANLRRKLLNEEQLRADIKDLEDQLKLAGKRLPDEQDIPNLLASVDSAGRLSGLEMLLFRKKPENVQDFYAEVPVDIQMRGTYRQLSAFLERITKLDRIVNAVDLSIREPVVSSEAVQVNVGATAVTFRFLSEEERKRIEAQQKRQKK